jgi:hypothetical protein
MAAASAARTRGNDVSQWVLTSLALSLLLHVLIIYVVGSIRRFDTEEFAQSVARWFHVVEFPSNPIPPPDIASDVTDMQPQVTSPQPTKPLDIPLSDHGLRQAKPSHPDEKEPATPVHPPTPVRPPDTELSVIHRPGNPDVDQTNAALGEIAQPRPGPLVDVAPSGTGGRLVLRGTTGIAALPRPVISLADVKAPRPAGDTHAAELTPPTPKPSATAVEVGALMPKEGVRSLDEALARRESQSPPLIIFPPSTTPGEPEPSYPFADEISVRMDMYARPGEPLHYFRIEIAVAKPEKLPVIPKDVMFICDVSRSIRRAKVIAARDAIAAYLRQLRPTDRFNVVTFSEETRKLFPDFAEPTPERIEAAAAFVDRIPGQVNTDVYSALDSIIRDVAGQSVRNRPTNILLISDGRSTMGIRDTRRIVNDIGSYAQPNFAIFPFDSGPEGNLYLLDLLAYRSRGELTFVENIEDAEKRLGKLLQAFDKPVLMQLQLLYTNLDVQETYPGSLPNLYADHPIVVYGRCRPGQNVTIQLQGKTPYARRTLTFSHTPGAADPSRADVAQDWARRKIHHIVSDMARSGESAELKGQVERIGREYNVRTPYR